MIDPQVVVAASGVILASAAFGITRWIRACRRSGNGSRSIRMVQYGVPRYGRTTGNPGGFHDEDPEVTLRTIRNVILYSGAWIDKEAETLRLLELHNTARQRAGMEALW